jgi:hypothetical protein
MVRLLIRELGADVSQLHYNFTALCFAARYRHEHLVRSLVKEFGADVN